MTAPRGRLHCGCAFTLFRLILALTLVADASHSSHHTTHTHTVAFCFHSDRQPARFRALSCGAAAAPFSACDSISSSAPLDETVCIPDSVSISKGSRYDKYCLGSGSTAFTMSRQQHGDGQLLEPGQPQRRRGRQGRRLERSQAGNATVFRSQLLRPVTQDYLIFLGERFVA